MRYGRATHDYAVREARADEAGPVLKRYVTVATKTRPQFQAAKDSPVEDFIAEAHRHPCVPAHPTSWRPPTAGTSPPLTGNP